MKSASQLLYERMGYPDIGVPLEVIRFGSGSNRCWMCGGYINAGVPINKWLGEKFTSANRIASPSSRHVCPACVYICARLSPVPGREPGSCSKCKGVPGRRESCAHCEGTGRNPLGGSFRNYSHLYDAGNYFNATKAEKPKILSFLRGPHKGPWFAAIADSGQKHVVPFTPVNPPISLREVVMFEETRIELPREATGWSIVDDAVKALTAGATKWAMETGEYAVGEWERAHAEIEEFERKWGRLRGGAWFSLVLWLVQRDEEQVARRQADEAARKRERKAANRNRRGVVVNSCRVFGAGGERDQALDAVVGPDEGSRADKREPGGVVHDHASDAADKGSTIPTQLDLFA